MPKLMLRLEANDLQNLGVTPWFSYNTTLPKRPLPSLSERPHFKTERLLVRPIGPDDLDAFYELRKCAETQEHSKTRGRPDWNKEETEKAIEALVSQARTHWYFGAFLLSTGEMIGEGGLPDCTIMSTSNSGWPEAEFLIKPQYWRQGYGSEMFKPIIDSWWALPREKRRLQIIPALAQGAEAGSKVPESLVFQWEERNARARHFFAKMLAQVPATAEGSFESCDTREGREGTIVKWAGTLVVSPEA
ncbi:hypothetical protein M406DRAFT_341246 [Cryphonectria parasitica EP155]|uniref:N-acetyltransferase domain-containing protein n=1 Tax=Cryphonectria parasitica (strain ATCC 38755 / EP155) TaxID=660469 RepID=A0A9P4XYT6_CRYP1|nr:uncharacterized protein M406DRAFT_341246 [Cryphonectria parasitica EP155]KAF3763837.1 hypothetical protein M406DRAFT_341246 [Cryphonectria parasitica EP155]